MSQCLGVALGRYCGALAILALAVLAFDPVLFRPGLLCVCVVERYQKLSFSQLNIRPNAPLFLRVSSSSSSS